jgi:Protease inhibitor/seed storage/LTP family
LPIIPYFNATTTLSPHHLFSYLNLITHETSHHLKTLKNNSDSQCSHTRSLTMKPTALLALALVLALALATTPILTNAAVTCSDVYTDLMPCLGYVQGGTMSSSCCSGIRDLMSAASTTADRQTACRCIKSVASGASGSYTSRAMGIPGQCGISMPYKLSPNTNCAK